MSKALVVMNTSVIFNTLPHTIIHAKLKSATFFRGLRTKWKIMCIIHVAESSRWSLRCFVPLIFQIQKEEKMLQKVELQLIMWSFHSWLLFFLSLLGLLFEHRFWMIQVKLFCTLPHLESLVLCKLSHMIELQWSLSLIVLHRRRKKQRCCSTTFYLSIKRKILQIWIRVGIHSSMLH